MSDEHQDLAERRKATSAKAEPQGDQNDWIARGDDGKYLYSVELIDSDEGSSIDDDAPEGVREYRSVEVHGAIVYGAGPSKRLPFYLSKEQKGMIQGLTDQIDLGAGADVERLRSLISELKTSGLVLADEMADLCGYINRQVPHARLVITA